MRKILLVSALLTIAVLSAQYSSEDKLIIEKGTWLLNGSLSLNFSNSRSNDPQFSYDNYERRDVIISPAVGFTFSPNWILGLGLGYGHSTLSDNSEPIDGNVSTFESTSNSVIVAPYLKRYFGVGKNLSLFIQGESSYTKVWFDSKRSDFDDYSDDSNRFFVGLRPGITFFAAKKFALETTLGSLGYSKSKSEQNDGNKIKSDSFGLSLNTSDLFFGLSYYF